MINFIRAKIEDAETLLEKQIKTFDEDTRQTFDRPAGGPPGYDSLDVLHQEITENMYFKIMKNDKIIGGIHVTDMDSDHYNLTRIYVEPEEQNNGIGQKAINFLEEEFSQVVKWSLDTPSVAKRNHHLYEKMGYRKVNEMILDKATSLSLFFYEKDINQ
ncbi:MAG: GNAT family N-acetyltransferase [Clostridiales bacterium]|nr:GNAT family N-acetyltransferase [Clostridiales bacterium]